jgi:hypothetical protein
MVHVPITGIHRGMGTSPVVGISIYRGMARGCGSKLVAGLQPVEPVRR